MNLTQHSLLRGQFVTLRKNKEITVIIITVSKPER